MKTRIYIRVARNGAKIRAAADIKDNPQPLFIPNWREKKFLPTVRFAVDFDIPEELFSQASKVIAEIDVTLGNVKIAAELAAPAPTDTPVKDV